jgi:hypothetical protein
MTDEATPPAPKRKRGRPKIHPVPLTDMQRSQRHREKLEAEGRKRVQVTIRKEFEAQLRKYAELLNK